jgi:hypothetical protein
VRGIVAGSALSCLFAAHLVAQPVVEASSTPPRKPQPEQPSAFGPNVSYYVVGAAELSPEDNTATYACNGSWCANRYSTNYTGNAFVAAVHLPAGALVTYFELDYYDVAPAGQAFASFMQCDYAGQTCTNPHGACPDNGSTICSSYAGAEGYSFAGTDVSGSAITIDNFGHKYYVMAGNTVTDGTASISQIIIGYKLQVSSPTIQTFNDVPPSNIYYQFVEALAASGITGGCGGGNFCPDSPVTRAQMATFLAKALGLTFQ